MGKKPRIALFGIGTLGGDQSGQGIPVIADLFHRLSEHYDIVFYSFTRVRLDNVPPSIQVRQIIDIRFPWRLKFLFLFFRALVDHFSRSYDLLFSVSVYPSGLFALMLSWVIRRPLVVQMIASEATNIEGISAHSKKKWLWWITKFVCRRADYLVTVADYQKTLAEVALSTSRQIDVVPLRINPDHFIYRKREITYPVHFIQVAFYGAVKDQDTMFQAFAKISRQIDCELHVIGFGFDAPKVTSMLDALGIRSKVKLHGFVGQDKLAAYYDRSHILLHTARFETGCAVIQEAMASGVGVCGTNVGLLADIGDRYAMIVPVQQPDELASAALGFVRNGQLFRQKTDRAYEWIRQHDAQWSYQNYRAYIDSIISKRH